MVLLKCLRHVQVLYFQLFYENVGTVAMHNITYTSHTLLFKNVLHIFTICRDSSEFVNSLRL